jgi:hypothetical protein
MKFGHVISIALLVAVSACCAKNKISKNSANQSVQKEQKFEAYYTFSSEATYESVVIKDTKLKYSFLKEAKGNTVQWIDQKPFWSPENITVLEADVTSAEIDTLIEKTEKAGFWKLDSLYGATDETQRCYPFDLTIVVNGTKKHVLFKSVPGGILMPDAFRKTRDEIVRFARKKTQGK